MFRLFGCKGCRWHPINPVTSVNTECLVGSAARNSAAYSPGDYGLCRRAWFSWCLAKLLIVWCCVSLLPGNEICAECNAGDFWLGDSAAKNEKERIGKCVEFINGLTPEQRKSLLAFLKHIKREINDFFGGMPIPIEALWYFMIVHGERLEEPEWPR